MSGEFKAGDQAQEQPEQQRKKKQLQDTLKAKQAANKFDKLESSVPEGWSGIRYDKQKRNIQEVDRTVEGQTTITNLETGVINAKIKFKDHVVSEKRNKGEQNGEKQRLDQTLDAKKIGMKNAVRKEIKLNGLKDLPDDYKDKAKLELGLHPRDKAFEKDGRFYLPNVESGDVKWTESKNISQGYSKLNNNLVYRKSNEIQAQHRYLEDPKAINEEWRRRTNAPLVDLYGRKVEMDEQILQRTVKTNKMLNRWMESYLKKGDSLESARKKTQERALNALKITIAPLVGLSI